MKKIILTTMILLASLGMSAQEKGSHNFELGLGAGINFLNNQEVSRKIGPGAYFEYRYGLSDSFDLGARLNYAFSTGTYDSAGAQKPALFHQGEALIVADWNLLPDSDVRPFIGAGIGAGYGMYKSRESAMSRQYVLGVAQPRIGVQFGEHFRAAVNVNLAFERASQKEIKLSKPFNQVAVTLGWVF